MKEERVDCLKVENNEGELESDEQRILLSMRSGEGGYIDFGTEM